MLTQMHLPQSLPLHRINGFARFFGFLSVLLLHSGHISKLRFFHCFSNVLRVLYAIMVPHRSLNFTWHHLILPSPHSFHRFSSRFTQFSKHSTQIFHCFPILFPLFYVMFPHFFHCFSHHFPSIAISPSPARRADQGGIDTPPSPNCHLVHNPKKVYLGPPFFHLIS